ncbi:MAG TPA: hypothetical protein VMV44_08445, partial [Rectinemataceae bacterium]|nr:hypothetical protein [Rectinemataceae bacterium]
MAGNAFIREARRDDAEALARLAGQLGYPCSDDDVKARLARHEGKDDRIILVAEADDAVLGWASLEIVDRFYLLTRQLDILLRRSR